MRNMGFAFGSELARHPSTPRSTNRRLNERKLNAGRQNVAQTKLAHTKNCRKNGAALEWGIPTSHRVLWQANYAGFEVTRHGDQKPGQEQRPQLRLAAPMRTWRPIKTRIRKVTIAWSRLKTRT